jgi:hypothetical protein
LTINGLATGLFRAGTICWDIDYVEMLDVIQPFGYYQKHHGSNPCSMLLSLRTMRRLLPAAL